LFALEASAVGQSEELPTSSLENDAESSVVMQADHVSCDSAQSTPRSLLDIRLGLCKYTRTRGYGYTCTALVVCPTVNVGWTEQSHN